LKRCSAGSAMCI